MSFARPTLTHMDASLREEGPDQPHDAQTRGDTALIRLHVDGADGPWRRTYNRLADSPTRPLSAVALGDEAKTVIVVQIPLEPSEALSESESAAAAKVLDAAVKLIPETNEQRKHETDMRYKAGLVAGNWWRLRAQKQGRPAR